MYTEQMARAFHSIEAPKNFSVQILENEHFVTVKANEKQFMSLSDFEKRRAVEYLARVKNALEQNGAIVLLVRDGAE
jgi:hypothetical protein